MILLFESSHATLSMLTLSAQCTSFPFFRDHVNNYEYNLPWSCLVRFFWQNKNKPWLMVTFEISEDIPYPCIYHACNVSSQQINWKMVHTCRGTVHLSISRTDCYMYPTHIYDLSFLNICNNFCAIYRLQPSSTKTQLPQFMWKHHRSFSIWNWRRLLCEGTVLFELHKRDVFHPV
jgi:hypothetical protein